MRLRHIRTVAFLVGGLLVVLGGCGSRSMGGGDDPDDPYCGDGLRQSAEQCDGADLAGQSCATLGFMHGTLGCHDDCTFDTSGCFLVEYCGNGLYDPPYEECDGPHLGNMTCADFGYNWGALACAADCTYDFSDCGIIEDHCGDGVIEPGMEECDGDDLGGETCESLGYIAGYLACSPVTCLFDTSQCLADPLCGNGFVQPGEQCDGNDLGGASCQSLGFHDGALSCNTYCQYDTTHCCNDQCPNEWLSQCNGNVLAECAMQPTGCLDWSTFDCASINLVCMASSGGAACGPAP